MRDRHSWSVSGQSNVEYALLISLVVVVVIAALVLLKPSLDDVIETAEETLVPDALTPASTSVITPTPSLEPTPTPTPIPTPTPEPEKRLSYSDFEDGDELEWYQARGRKWNVEDGEYCVDGGGEHRSFTGDEDWTDYAIELQARLDKGKGFGIYFRATNPDKVNAYCFQYDPGYGKGAFLFRKVENGREKRPLVTAWLSEEYDWYSSSHKIRLEVVGDTYTAFVDGEQVAQLIDNSYKHGAIGLRSWDSSRVCFDDVAVTRIK